MDDSYARRHEMQRLAGIADKAEIHAMRYGSAVVDDGLVSERIAAADDDSPPEVGNRASWHQMDLDQEGRSGGARDNVQRRAELLGNRYPFALPYLQYSPSDSLVYEFCLAICNAPNLTSGEYKHLPRVFERLSCVLAETYIGLGADSQHLGWPRDKGGRTGTFQKAIAPIYKKTQEWAWSPEVKLPQNPTVKDVKDGGLDLLAWKKIDDRSGSLFFLGHCACGDNWQTKFHDANPMELSKWFNPMTLASPPVRLFFTPYHVVDAVIREASRVAGIVLDRVRLTLLAEQSTDLRKDKWLRRRLRELVELVSDGNTK